jgi:hypothetical protein
MAHNILMEILSQGYYLNGLISVHLLSLSQNRFYITSIRVSELSSLSKSLLIIWCLKFIDTILSFGISSLHVNVKTLLDLILELIWL